MKKSKLILGLTLAAALGFAGVQQGHLLKRAPKVGETTKYKLMAEIDISGQKATYSSMVVDKVVKVSPQGQFTVNSAQLEPKLIIGSDELPMPTSDPMVVTYEPYGGVVEILDAKDPESYRLAYITTFRASEQELKVGDTWKHEIAADSKRKTYQVLAEYTVLGEETVDKWETFKIKVSVKEASPDATTNVGHLWVDKATGILVKVDQAWTNAPFPGAPGPINAKVTMVRTE